MALPFAVGSDDVHDFEAIPRVRSLEPMKDIRREIERRNDTPAKSPAGAPVTAEPKVTA